MAGVSFLLLPQDELELVEKLTGEFSLTLLASDLAPGGKPNIVASPLDALPDDLALPVRPGKEPSAPAIFLFWCSGIGPIQMRDDSAPSDDPVDRVADLLTREATDDWRDLIDLSRTPVIRFHRSAWHDDDRTRMKPALLQAMPVPVKKHPVQVSSLHAAIEKWMKTRGERLDPFDYCTELPIEPPRSRSRFGVWAWPQACGWVREGGEIWPWTG